MIIFYGVSAAGNFLLVLPQHGYDVVTDATGVQWSVSTITQTCAVVTVLTMGAFALWLGGGCVMNMTQQKLVSHIAALARRRRSTQAVLM